EVRLQPLDPDLQGLLGVVEDPRVGRELPFRELLARHADRDLVAGVFGEGRQPVPESLFVQRQRLPIEEILDRLAGFAVDLSCLQSHVIPLWSGSPARSTTGCGSWCR